MGQIRGRPVDAAAMQRVIAHYSATIPAAHVRRVVERYCHEQWLGEVAKNPRIMLLASLTPGGKGTPWPYVYTNRHGRQYLQSADRYRAQALLGDPEAKWQIYYSRQRVSEGKSDVMIRRVY